MSRSLVPSLFAVLVLGGTACGGSAQPTPAPVVQTVYVQAPTPDPGAPAAAQPVSAPPSGPNPVDVVASAITKGCSAKGDHCFQCKDPDPSNRGNFHCTSAKEPKDFMCAVANYADQPGRGWEVNCYITPERAFAKPCAKFTNAMNDLQDANRKVRVECYDEQKQFNIQQTLLYPDFGDDPGRVREAVGQFMAIAADDLKQLDSVHALKK